MDFSHRIKELRAEKQITQRELASHLHLSSNLICEWEKGRCSPNIDTLKKLSDFFECTVDYLIGNTDDLGNVTVYQQTDALSSLSANEQKIIDALRRKTSKNASELLKLYSELPPYMQDSIFAELKGMHLGYTVSKNKNTVEG